MHNNFSVIAVTHIAMQREEKYSYNNLQYIYYSIYSILSYSMLRDFSTVQRPFIKQRVKRNEHIHRNRSRRPCLGGKKYTHAHTHNLSAINNLTLISSILKTFSHRMMNLTVNSKHTGSNSWGYNSTAVYFRCLICRYMCHV